MNPKMHAEIAVGAQKAPTQIPVLSAPKEVA
jgi:hypothetical protein